MDDIERAYRGHNVLMHGEEKLRLRAGLVAARRARAAEEIESAREAIRLTVLARCVQLGWRCVAGYEPLPTEPGSRELLAGLHGLGVSVIVPRMLADMDLDWIHWHPDPEWPRPALGVQAIASADAILVPALAVATDGTRLGRGGGSYDRALARARQVEVAALLFDDEVVGDLPKQAWDQRVTAIVSPSGWREIVR